MIGLDNRDFAMWRYGLKYIFGPGNVFQPVIFPTNPAVIDAILRQSKDGPHAHFAGNQSTDIMGQLAGHDNIFAAKDAKTHHMHKSQFLEFLADKERNVLCAGPIIKKWIKTNSGKTIPENTISTLCAQLMLAFLLNPKAAENPEFVNDIQNIKTHFVDKGTNVQEKMFGFFNFSYKNSKKALSDEIRRLYQSKENSYPKVLADKKFTLEQTDSHVRSLLMVGFDNLYSSLLSMTYRLAEHPEYNEKLIQDIQNIGRIHFIDFDQHEPDQKQIERTFRQKFFAEALRLNLPVWLQARKAKLKDVTINYEEAGEQKSFILPGKTLVLIPNYQLARSINNGNDFIPERKESTPQFPFPFSMGRNNCPGRNIGYASTGVLVAELLSTQTLQLVSKPTYDPKVALLMKNMKIKLVPKEVELREVHEDQIEQVDSPRFKKAK